ncbi:MAG: hypothetical protein IKY18_04860 [Oscillospiraceae bacterium]|nr:hypothetical protein [Oscillospiraceae bacterium]
MEDFLHIAQNESIRFVAHIQEILAQVPYGAIIINLAQKIKSFFEKIVLTAQKTFCIIKKSKKRTQAQKREPIRVLGERREIYGND